MSNAISTPKLTQARLKELLHYDPDTGVFTWRETGPGRKNGLIAGCLRVDGYWFIAIDQQRYLAHRLAWFYVHGYFPENDTDHINRIRTDNRISNLREASRQCNSRNSGLLSTNTSGIKGVCWNKNYSKWQANITDSGKQIYLGCYDTIVDAAKARWSAEVKYNFPNCNSSSSAYTYLKNKGLI